MARIRTIKPEFPQSESMGRMSRDARLLFILMWTLADDAGRLRGNSRVLCGQLFPYDDDAPKNIDSWVDELVAEDCIIRYSSGGAQYIQIVAWLQHQKIDKPSESRLPKPPESLDASKTPQQDSDSSSPRESSRKSRESSRTFATDSRSLATDLGPSTKDHGPRTVDHEHGPRTTTKDQSEASASCRSGSKSDAVSRVFSHYQSYHPTCRLTDDRRKMIQARLKEGYSEDDLCRAIDGLHLSPHHRGENDRSTAYLDIQYALRKGDAVSRMINIANRPPSAFTATTMANSRAAEEFIAMGESDEGVIDVY